MGAKKYFRVQILDLIILLQNIKYKISDNKHPLKRGKNLILE